MGIGDKNPDALPPFDPYKGKQKPEWGVANFKIEVDQNREDSSEAPNGDCLGYIRLMGQKMNSHLCG